ncbi:MAG: MBOAT family protein [Alphaproteobacteria bacterium]|nr:MBOAT family protein [Alphaproteobacteria bacterium]
MLFPTLNFALFFLAVYVIAWAIRSRDGARKGFLVAASYVFYANWDWRFVFLLFGSSVLNYLGGLWIAGARSETRRKGLVAAVVAANLGVLGLFKYHGFFLSSLSDLLNALGLGRDLPFLEIVLPIGISFFTFHGISYVVDVYRGRIEACRSFPDILLYISFFPQLVAGPIVRAHFFLPQLRTPPDPNGAASAGAFLLIVLGLFKKVVVANYLATELVDPVFTDPSYYGPVDLILAAYGYAIQIYCDFSAYTDIATGVAALLGYRFPPNFNQPYRSRSLREFWTRWHISLSSWLREYLYIPLGGNRQGAGKTLRNLFLTMLLGGLWHGAAWNFVCWGALHGAGLVVERVFGKVSGTVLFRHPALAVFAVFHFVCLAWIFFRAPDVATAWTYLGSLANVEVGARLASPFVLFLLALGAASQALPESLFPRVEARLARLPAPAQGAMLGVMIFLIDALGPEGVAPFIYFQF